MTKITGTRIVSALLCAALLLSFAPASVRAQTQAAAGEARGLTAPHAEQKPTLKAMFSESAFKTRTGAPTRADFKRFEAGRWQNAPDPPKSRGWSTRKKVIVIVAAAAVIALAAWGASKSDGEVPPLVSCSEDPFDPNCI